MPALAHRRTHDDGTSPKSTASVGWLQKRELRDPFASTAFDMRMTMTMTAIVREAGAFVKYLLTVQHMSLLISLVKLLFRGLRLSQISGPTGEEHPCIREPYIHRTSRATDSTVRSLWRSATYATRVPTCGRRDNNEMSLPGSEQHIPPYRLLLAVPRCHVVGRPSCQACRYLLTTA